MKCLYYKDAERCPMRGKYLMHERWCSEIDRCEGYTEQPLCRYFKRKGALCEMAVAFQGDTFCTSGDCPGYYVEPNINDEELENMADLEAIEVLSQEAKERSAAIDPKSRYYDEGGIEVMDILKAKLTKEQFLGFILGNVMKYSLRLNWKGVPERDGEKIKVYGEILKEILKG